MDVLLTNGDGQPLGAPDQATARPETAWSRMLLMALSGKRPMQHADLSRSDQGPESLRRTTTEAVELLLARGVSARRITVVVQWGADGRGERLGTRGRFLRDPRPRATLTDEARAMAAHRALDSILGLQSHLERRGVRHVHLISERAQVPANGPTPDGLAWMQRAIDWSRFVSIGREPVVLERWAMERDADRPRGEGFSPELRMAFIEGVLVPWMRDDAMKAQGQGLAARA